ncbi:MAG TPA: hypothetical protein EYH15_05335 [Methanothermococcus okinawensis]|uniref:Type II secretion system protein GspF domain-containing protein n=1 Tax=Methanothermococcus okinawensis TaxID=155863 RepID=A0A832ZDB5_9EURY|nr:hypothetical protein [Methanococcaceae archaeon]HIP84894.1 hypothetical protein [Methanothermococcus okinawensis]HIP91141.1 hypothetical protein [Methanothermococcus okinawensis]
MVETLRKFFSSITDFLDEIVYLIRGRRRRRKKISTVSEKVPTIYDEVRDELLEFYEVYEGTEGVLDRRKLETEVDIDKIMEDIEVEVLKKYTKEISYQVIRTKFLPSKVDFQYAGIKDINKYFLKLTVFSILVGIAYFLYLLDNPPMAIVSGIIASIVVFILGIFYPKIKLLLFRGEIKMQILVALLTMIALLNAGMSLQEAIKNIAESPEFGIPSFEFRSIVKDIERGYSLKEALERARKRTKIPLMKKLYTQLLISLNKGGAQLLLRNLYKEILRESMSKIESSKFQITNLGNLVFGVGVILPFSGMMLSSIQGNTGLTGVINTLDLVLTKIAPVLALVFALFVKFKIE